MFPTEEQGLCASRLGLRRGQPEKDQRRGYAALAEAEAFSSFGMPPQSSRLPRSERSEKQSSRTSRLTSGGDVVQPDPEKVILVTPTENLVNGTDRGDPQHSRTGGSNGWTGRSGGGQRKEIEERRTPFLRRRRVRYVRLSSTYFHSKNRCSDCPSR